MAPHYTLPLCVWVWCVCLEAIPAQVISEVLAMLKSTGVCDSAHLVFLFVNSAYLDVVFDVLH